MPPTLKVVALCVVAGALGLGPVASSAGATRRVTITSHVTIQGKGLRFTGKVTASKSPCKANRRVTLYRKLSNGSSTALLSTTTSASGSWKITVPGSAGITMSRFYASAKKRNEGTAGTIYVCAAATSKTIPYKA